MIGGVIKSAFAGCCERTWAELENKQISNPESLGNGLYLNRAGPEGAMAAGANAERLQRGQEAARCRRSRTPSHSS